MKKSIFDTGCATSSGLVSHMPEVVRYLLTNKADVITREEISRMVQPIRNILKTPLSDFFDRIVQCHQLTNFAPIYVPKNNSVPDLLAANNITLDLKQSAIADGLKSIPSLHGKVVVNITPTVRPDRGVGFTINSIDSFQNLFVRGQLVASYHDSDGAWLSPVLTEYTAKSYSMTLSGLVAKYYNLDNIKMIKMFGLFALFMCQRLSDSSDSLTKPVLFNRCTFAGNMATLNDLMNECEEIAPQGLTLQHICDIIKSWFGDIVNDLTVGTLMRLAAPLYRDDIVSMQIAMEYPPYWFFMLLRAFSGAKSPLVYELTAHRIFMDGKTKFLAAVTNNNMLMDVRR